MNANTSWPEELFTCSQSDAWMTGRVLVVSDRPGDRGPDNELLHSEPLEALPRDPDAALRQTVAGFGDVLGQTTPFSMASGTRCLRAAVDGRGVRALLIPATEGVLSVYDDLEIPEVTFYWGGPTGGPRRVSLELYVPDVVRSVDDGAAPHPRWDLADRDRWLAWAGFEPMGLDAP